MRTQPHRHTHVTFQILQLVDIIFRVHLILKHYYIRKNTSMEDPNAMTIEFLRARLLSERSVSKSARQRADELAKRVAELEEQLKFVTLQRKKAEMATADVLAILEDHGISDVSEGFDSSSDQEETLYESNSHNDMATRNETSTNTEVRRNDTEAYSSSEIESSPSTGRSLSWKSGKDSRYSLERKKYLDLARRRASFASSASSTRRAGKSCRRIRHRETRSVTEESRDDVHKVTESSHIEADTLRKSSEHDKEENLLKNPPVMVEKCRQESNGHYSGENGEDNDMERALKRQAQLIGQYEEEEKAQREWEEKFRENNSYTPDSFDPGNHSDVTEEEDETKAPELPCSVGTSSDNQEKKSGPVEAYLGDKPRTCSNLQSASDASRGNSVGQRSSGMITSESSAPESSPPTPMGNNDQQFSGEHHNLPLDHSHQYLPSSTSSCPSTKISTCAGNSLPLYVPSGTSSSRDLAVMPQETSTDLGSVLEKLQQAKLSLKQNLNSLPLVRGRTSGNVVESSNLGTNPEDRFRLPVAYPGLFRLPIDYEYEASNRGNPSGIGSQLGFPKISSGVGDPFLSNAAIESRRAFTVDQFRNVPPSPFTEVGPGLPTQWPPLQPRLSAGFDGLNYRNPPLNVLPSSSNNAYSFFPDFTVRLPSSEGILRTSPSSEMGVPPLPHFALYNDPY